MINKEQMKAYHTERKKLIEEIQTIRQANYELLYEKINKLYQLEINHDPEFTIRQLAVDLSLSEQYLYKMLSYNNAPDEVKKMVKDKKINLMKAVRVLSFIGKRDKKYILKVFNYVCNKKMTDGEIDSYIRKSGIKDVELIRDRNEKDGWNLFRDITLYCFRLKNNLPNIRNIPKKKIPETKQALIDVQDKIKLALEIMEDKNATN